MNRAEINPYDDEAAQSDKALTAEIRGELESLARRRVYLETLLEELENNNEQISDFPTNV